MEDRAKIEQVIEGLHHQLTSLYELVGETPPDAVVRTLADTFCRMDDDQQAKFFVEVAKQMSRWTTSQASSQAWHIGRHLATCACSTPEARELLHDIDAAIKYSQSHP